MAGEDHPTGIYHAKVQARLRLTVDNTSDEPLPLSGELLFGSLQSAAPGAPASFKTLSVTPLARSTLRPGARATIPLQVTFAAPGSYEVRWSADNKPIPHVSGTSLQCIFAPRLPLDRNDSPWLTSVPRQAPHTPGYLADYVLQTSIHRFLIDERFAFDPQANVGLGFGASLGQGEPIGNREVDAFLAEVSQARASLILRVTVPSSGIPDPRTLAGFRQYLADAIRRSRSALRAVVIAPDDRTAETAEGLVAYRAFYLAGYEAAKAENKNLLMLGAGTAQATRFLLLSQNLAPYLDAIAITDASIQPALLGEAPRRPLWVLPPPVPEPWRAFPPTPPAAALALPAAVVPLPPPAIDRGVHAHLLGGAVLFQRVHLAVAAATQGADPAPVPPNNELPFIAVFQGDGYAVAAIAGFSAGTPIDALYPELARTRSVVELLIPSSKPAHPNLEIGDDTHSMRVVDTEGTPVDCRVGDSLFVPAGDKVMYILQAGNADELAGPLRPAILNRFPMVSLQARRASPEILSLRLINIRPREVGGSLRILIPPDAPGGTPRLLAEKDFPPISPGKHVELPLELSSTETLPLDRPLIAEVVTPAQVQRTALQLLESK